MKKIIIIGASSGIGKKMAELYASNGNLVGITGRRESLLQEIQTAYPDKIFVKKFDAMDENSPVYIQALIDEMGGCDIFIYNAGYAAMSKQLDWKVDDITIQTNVNGFARSCNYIFNYFAQKGTGHLVGISSIASLMESSWVPAYSASKAFMSNYIGGLRNKAIRMKKQIYCIDIKPGFVDTAMAQGENLFWMAPVEKAAKQIIDAIEQKKSSAYITKRWWLVAMAFKLMPSFMIRKFF